MGYGLRSGLSYCLASGRLIFLDLQADRYFCLNARAEAAFANLVAGHPLADADQAAIDRLVATGHLVPDGKPAAPAMSRLPPVALTSVCDDIAVSGSARHLGAAIWNIALAEAAVRALALHRIIHRLQRLKLVARHRDRDAANSPFAEIAVAFQRSGVIAPRHDRCLPRSVALTRYLLRLGHEADLIFGVMARPFAAHCWVQCGNVVLNDRVDHVRNFTPILVI